MVLNNPLIVTKNEPKTTFQFLFLYSRTIDMNAVTWQVIKIRITVTLIVRENVGVCSCEWQIPNFNHVFRSTPKISIVFAFSLDTRQLF